MHLPSRWSSLSLLSSLVSTTPGSVDVVSAVSMWVPPQDYIKFEVETVAGLQLPPL